MLLEQHYVPGGCATTFKRKDFLMEVGLHEMDGLDPSDPKINIFDFLGVRDNVELLQAPELFRLINGNQEFVFPHGEDASREALNRQFPHEKKAIAAFYKLIAGVRREIEKIPTKSWQTTLLLPVFPLLFPNTVAASRITLGDYLDKRFTDEALKLVLIANLGYYHDDPYSMSLIYFAVAQAGYIQGGGHFVKGGSQRLSDHLAGVIKANGGVVLLGKQASEIRVDRGKVCGVVYRDSFNPELPEASVQTGNVIANAAPSLVAEMLPQPLRSKLKNKIAKQQPACSLLSVYIGFDADLSTLGSRNYSTFFGGNEAGTISDFNANCHLDFDRRPFVFVDYGQIDSGLAPTGKTFGCICCVDYLSDWENLDEAAYRTKKEDVAQILFARLEEHLPGITETISHYEVGTPKTIQNYTSNPSGTPYGFAQIPSQAGIKRFAIQSQAKGLRFASAWSFPGGGFSGAIISGFLCAQDACRGLAKAVQAPALHLRDARSVRFAGRRKIARNTFELSFEKPEGFAAKPGQYAFVSLDKPKYDELDVPVRPLSIVSDADENVVRFAMHISDSAYKRSCMEMGPQDTATLYGPTGDFQLPDTDRPIVFVAGGIGITPVVPMVKALERRGFPAKTAVIYSGRHREEMAYLDELEAIRSNNFMLHTITTASQPRIDEAYLRGQLCDLSGYHYFIVGSGGFLDSMNGILKRQDVDPAQISVDDFG